MIKGSIDKQLQQELITGITTYDVAIVQKSLFAGANINVEANGSAAPVYCILDHAVNNRYKGINSKTNMLEIARICMQAGMDLNEKTCPNWFGTHLHYYFRSWGNNDRGNPTIMYLRDQYFLVNGQDPFAIDGR